MSKILDFFMKKTLTFEQGHIMLLKKVDFFIHTSRSMAAVLQKISEDFGEEFNYELGYDAGMIAAKEFDENFGWVKMPKITKMSMVYRMFELMGYGGLDIKTWDGKNNRLMYHVVDHPVIKHAKKMYGKKSKVCVHYMGMESAHFHNEMGVDNCRVVETQCVTRGDSYCEWSYNFFSKDTIDKNYISGPKK